MIDWYRNPKEYISISTHTSPSLLGMLSDKLPFFHEDEFHVVFIHNEWHLVIKKKAYNELEPSEETTIKGFVSGFFVGFAVGRLGHSYAGV